jgi:hypothetical protein
LQHSLVCEQLLPLKVQHLSAVKPRPRQHWMGDVAATPGPLQHLPPVHSVLQHSLVCEQLLPLKVQHLSAVKPRPRQHWIGDVAATPGPLQHLPPVHSVLQHSLVCEQLLPLKVQHLSVLKPTPRQHSDGVAAATPGPSQQVPAVQFVSQQSLVIEQLSPLAVHCAVTEDGAIRNQAIAATDGATRITTRLHVMATRFSQNRRQRQMNGSEHTGSSVCVVAGEPESGCGYSWPVHQPWSMCRGRECEQHRMRGPKRQGVAG